MDPETFAQRATAYLRTALKQPNLDVTGAVRIVGGASRHTWSVDTSWSDDRGRRHDRGLVFRLDPPASLLQSHRGTEYAMYRAMFGRPGIPVPEPLMIEDDSAAMGMPFFVMERLDGVAMPHELLRAPLAGRRPELLREMYEILGRISSIEPAATGLDDGLAVPPPDAAWAVELDRWEAVLDQHDLGPMPITRGVIRALRRDPPPAAPRVTVVHGDYRVGNVLFVPDKVVGILDWELAHLGDPHEDLAWSFARNWRSASAPELVGSALAPEQALAAWTSTSKLAPEPRSLRWWGLFSHVKAAAIWATAAHEFAIGATKDLIFGTMGWLNLGAQERWMAQDLEVIGA
jgi:aminoglycoside phosphotransferase (APT) family kinase protein